MVWTTEPCEWATFIRTSHTMSNLHISLIQRKSCPTCECKRTTVMGAYEYIRNRRTLVQHVCINCFWPTFSDKITNNTAKQMREGQIFASGRNVPVRVETVRGMGVPWIVRCVEEFSSYHAQIFIRGYADGLLGHRFRHRIGYDKMPSTACTAYEFMANVRAYARGYYSGANETYPFLHGDKHFVDLMRAQCTLTQKLNFPLPETREATPDDLGLCAKFGGDTMQPERSLPFGVALFFHETDHVDSARALDAVIRGTTENATEAMLKALSMKLAAFLNRSATTGSMAEIERMNQSTSSGPTNEQIKVARFWIDKVITLARAHAIGLKEGHING